MTATWCAFTLNKLKIERSAAEASIAIETFRSQKPPSMNMTSVNRIRKPVRREALRAVGAGSSSSPARAGLADAEDEAVALGLGAPVEFTADSCTLCCPVLLTDVVAVAVLDG